MLIAAAVLSLAAASPPCTRVVLPTLGEASESLRSVVAEAIARGLEEGSRCRVLSPGDVSALLATESTRQLCGVEEASCLAELGEAMGADEVVATTLTAHDDGLTLEARALAPSTVAVLARTGAHVPARSSDVVAAAERAGRELRAALEPGSWSLPLMATGGVVTAAALATAAMAGLGWWWSSRALTSAAAKRDEKDLALASAPWWIGGAAVALAGAAVGVVVVAAGAVVE